MKIGSVHIGTSGWSYGLWKGKFYPEKIKSTDFLCHYSKTFSCTEVNSTFYHLPRITTIAGWLNKVPPGFMFCPKMSRYLTHIKRLKDPEEILSKFFTPFEQMKGQLGPVLIQLPPSLKFDFETAENLYALLQEKYCDYQFALEGRHISWLDKESIDLMKAHNIAFVISQSGVGFPYAEEITASNIYLRFHGPKELFKSSYSHKILESYAQKIILWKNQGYNVWAFFNNTMFMDAIENALDLIKLTE